jgi:hypothetical protein
MKVLRRWKKSYFAGRKKSILAATNRGIMRCIFVMGHNQGYIYDSPPTGMHMNQIQ